MWNPFRCKKSRPDVQAVQVTISVTDIDMERQAQRLADLRAKQYRRSESRPDKVPTPSAAAERVDEAARDEERRRAETERQRRQEQMSRGLPASRAESYRPIPPRPRPSAPTSASAPAPSYTPTSHTDSGPSCAPPSDSGASASGGGDCGGF